MCAVLARPFATDRSPGHPMGRIQKGCCLQIEVGKVFRPDQGGGTVTPCPRSGPNRPLVAPRGQYSMRLPCVPSIRPGNLVGAGGRHAAPRFALRFEPVSNFQVPLLPFRECLAIRHSKGSRCGHLSRRCTNCQFYRRGSRNVSLATSIRPANERRQPFWPEHGRSFGCVPDSVEAAVGVRSSIRRKLLVDTRVTVGVCRPSSDRLIDFPLRRTVTRDCDLGGFDNLLTLFLLRVERPVLAHVPFMQSAGTCSAHHGVGRNFGKTNVNQRLTARKRRDENFVRRYVALFKSRRDCGHSVISEQIRCALSIPHNENCNQGAVFA